MFYVRRKSVIAVAGNHCLVLGVDSAIYVLQNVPNIYLPQNIV